MWLQLDYVDERWAQAGSRPSVDRQFLDCLGALQAGGCSPPHSPCGEWIAAAVRTERVTVFFRKGVGKMVSLGETPWDQPLTLEGGVGKQH